MTETPTTPEPRRWSIRLYVPNGESITDDAQPKALLRNLIREEGFSLDASTMRRGKSEPVRVNDRGESFPWDGKAPAPDGYIVEWSAGANMPTTDEPPLVGTNADGVVTVDVPPGLSAAGGEVRVQHGLGGEVTVTALSSTGSPVGYQFASALDSEQVLVQFAAGSDVAMLRVTLDPDEVEAAPVMTPVRVPHPSDRVAAEQPAQGSPAAPLAP